MKTLFLFLFFCVFIAFPSRIFAAKSITFTVNLSSLKPDQEMIVIASPSGFQEGESIYIKGAFYKEGSSNYFGLTKNGDAWIKNSASTVSQRKVTIDTWDKTLIVRSDPSDSGFQDSGTYKFKIGFYTISTDGDPSSVRWSDTIVDVYLERPLPTNTCLLYTS
ncbi:MAG: hypothetical protein N3A54_04640, partial [Patescibacteria group bacterium]|nr:hypothetical protein [Patescibacteria group bacterium]